VEKIMARESAHQLAVKALERIASHEKECAEQWGATRVEIREMKSMLEKHSHKWDRLTWTIVSSVIGTSGISFIIASILPEITK
jgi:hypothetical protein